MHTNRSTLLKPVFFAPHCFSLFTGILLIALASLFLPNSSYAQGCIALRSLGQAGGLDIHQAATQSHTWEIGLDFRYFRSFRHYVGTVQQKQRVALGNNVINHAYTGDLNLSYGLNTRWSFNAQLPIDYFMRSQLIKGTDQREHTHAKGIGDLRLSADYWLLNPLTHHSGNWQLGVGIKLPTGKDDVRDSFYTKNQDGSLSARFLTVDQSIQPGDGGLGVSLELNGYQELGKATYAYGNFFYLLNPRESNGVPTYRDSYNPFESIMSVADQYMARVGVSYFPQRFSGFSASLGGRIEGIPVHDLIGGSEGFRRPGYVISVEPGLSYMYRHSEWDFSAPIAAIRNRTWSVPDQEKTAATGVYSHGDAAFADFLLSASYRYRF